ncbi:UDP-N-acetylmuramoyl-tripeptide--D-alanyl-D-alanine ligase [Mycoplasmatota bacterium]|nr:UDP-N-acetylmuramoyl-tripeptide--D-alanyl-D-alanine ligase [Mycoplasmatota bacterium]
MKILELNKLCEVLRITPVPVTPIKIKRVVTSVNDIDNNTLVFHLNKKLTINVKKFEQLQHCYIVTDQPLLKNNLYLKEKFLFVLDIDRTYEQFIKYYRSLFSIKTIAVTGTCGKTTTKEMIKQVLAKEYHITGTVLSKNSLRFNHDYLMDIDDTKTYGVYETALTEPGEIIYSAKFFKPSIGVITNIGIDHLSGCKTLDNYIRAKGEMISALKNKGTLIINGDDENIKKIDFSTYKGKLKTFGIKHKSDYTASKIRFEHDKMCFTLYHKKEKYKVSIPCLGEHNVYNALSALAVLDILGMPLKKAITHIASFKPIKSHFEIHKGLNDSVIIDDTWSSNPTSIKAAFKTFNYRGNTKVVVLGNISYLGHFASEQCKEIGKMIVDYEIDYLVTIDQFSKQIGDEAILNGMDEKNIFHCHNEDEIKMVLSRLLKPNVRVLFKTSMLDNKMKNIIKHLIKDDR